MRASWHDLWGCARGPVVRLAPRTRLLAGTGVFAACMIAPAGSRAGSVFIAAATLAWLAACRAPIRVVRLASLLGLALFLPYFLLLPIMPAAPYGSGEGLGRALAVPWSILFPKVVDDAAFGLLRRGLPPSEAMAKARETLGWLGVAHLAEAPLHHLSHGQKQRVALAGALVADPPLLLLDEPSAALDPPGKRALAQFLQGVGAAMVVATHDLDFARSLCARFVLLERGRIAFDGTDAGDVLRRWEAGHLCRPA